MKLSPEKTALKLLETKYSEAKALFLAGSVLRGEATMYSDLDIVIVFESLDHAYRDSFVFEGWPVEVFVHDESTLNYFFEKVDLPTGYPSLASMIKEAKVITEDNDFSKHIKKQALAFLDRGPKEWTKQDIDRARYGITDLVDDLREPRNSFELYGTAGLLYSALGNFYFRSQNLWSAKGKTIPRRLDQVDSEFASRFRKSFDELFKEESTASVIELSEFVLKPFGGFLFEGYKLDAPNDWRIE